MPDQDVPGGPPPEFHPRRMRTIGIEVLRRGLPPLPKELTYQMAIPVAYWTATRHAVVLFLQFFWSDEEAKWFPTVTMGPFTREGDGWTSPKFWAATDWWHDPLANPGDLGDLDGRAMVTGGGAETIRHGRVAPAVTEIGLIQDGHEDRRPLESHFGAWVVCTDQPSPIHVTAYDKNGVMLADIEES